MHLNKKNKSILLSFTLLFAFLAKFSAIYGHEPSANGHESVEAHQPHNQNPSNHNTKEGHGENAAHGEKEKFNPGDMIFDHVTNSHSWHLFGNVELSLPVIVFNVTKKKWDIFSSSKFEHGHASYLGYTAHQGKLTHDQENEFYDLSLTKNGAAAMLSSIILILIMLSVAKNYKKRGAQSPKGIASFVEPLVIFIKDEIVKPSIGKGYQKFLPYLLTLFFFIFACNLLGLIPVFPGGANITGSIAVTGILAIITFIITTFNGTKDYWKHIFLPPGVPKGLWIILIPIEIIGMLTKPFVLMVRLFANITAGHIIILGFFSLIFIFSEMSAGAGLGVSILSVAFTVFMSMLELLVAFLQAYVFVLLTSLYIGGARESHEHHEEAH